MIAVRVLLGLLPGRLQIADTQKEATSNSTPARLDPADPSQIVAFAETDGIAKLVKGDVNVGGLPRAYVLDQAMRAEEIDATWAPFAVSAIKDFVHGSLDANARLRVDCRTNFCEFQFVADGASDPERAHRLLDAIEKLPSQPWWHVVALDQWSGQGVVAGDQIAALYFSLRCPIPDPDMCAPSCKRDVQAREWGSRTQR